MALLDDLLLRFRRVWAPPGPAAGQPGVPVDLLAALDDELRDLSVDLDAIALEGEEIVHEAESAAAAILDAAQAESTRIVEAARLQAPQIRAEQAAARMRDRETDIARLMEQAEREAGEIQARARSRTGPVVGMVVEDVFAAAPAVEEGGNARVVGRG